MTTRTVSWGDALKVQVERYRGGMKAVAARLEQVFGPIDVP